MSLSHDTLLELMSLADDELEGHERDRVERLLVANDEARRVVESMRRGEIGAWLTTTTDRHAAASGADGIADAVIRAIGPTAARDAPQTPVVSMARARSARFSRVQAAAVAAVGAVALAAGVAMYVRSGDRALDDHVPVASVVAPEVDPQASAAAGLALAGGVEVNEIDAPSRGVSVFEIPLGAAAALAKPSEASSVVVWVDDDPGAK